VTGSARAVHDFDHVRGAKRLADSAVGNRATVVFLYGIGGNRRN
jgi:hypothetical protein